MLSKEEGGRHLHSLTSTVLRFMRTTDVTGEVKLPENVEMVMPGDNVTLEVELIFTLLLLTSVYVSRFAKVVVRLVQVRLLRLLHNNLKAYGCSSIGRVVVSKTIGWGFESLLPCNN